MEQLDAHVIRYYKYRKHKYSLEYYHRNKHKRGIKNKVRKTKEEQNQRRRDYERKIYAKALWEREKRLPRKPTPKEFRTTEFLHRKMLERCKKYREAHPDRKRQSGRNWASRNKNHGLAYQKQRYHTDPVFNLITKFRRRISTTLRNCYRGVRKCDSSINLLGCTFNEFKVYIEKQFTEGMTWQKCFNGEIHLDHRKPVSLFRMELPEEQRAAFNYTNHQPLWAADNLRKSDKWEPSPLTETPQSTELPAPECPISRPLTPVVDTPPTDSFSSSMQQTTLVVDGQAS